MHTTATSGLEATTSQIIMDGVMSQIDATLSLTMQNSGMYKSIYICIGTFQTKYCRRHLYNKIIIKYIQHSKLN